MLTRRTIEAAASATLDALGQMYDGKPADIAERAVAEESFADLAVHQLLKLTSNGIRARSAWAGYQGVSVARQLLDAFDENWNCWEPVMSLAVADAAIAIAHTSDKAGAALLFRAHKERANALRILSLFDAAFCSLDQAEELAADTECPTLHFAILANSRSSVWHEMRREPEALRLLLQGREGFARSGDTLRVNESYAAEGGICCGMGHYDDGRRLMELALADAEAGRDLRNVALQLGNLSYCLAQLGDIDAARRYIRRADAAYFELGWTVPRADLLATSALLDIRQFGIGALAGLERACAEYERLGRVAELVRTQMLFVEELYAVDPAAEIGELCQSVYTGALALGMTDVAEDALQILTLSRGSRDGGVDGARPRRDLRSC
jgi:tetratricopeptide (TPR) repeat protein